jgi:hypothetical protein
MELSSAKAFSALRWSRLRREDECDTGGEGGCHHNQTDAGTCPFLFVSLSMIFGWGGESDEYFIHDEAVAETFFPSEST